MNQISQTKICGKLIKLVCGMLVIVLAMSMTACKSREQISADVFKEKVESVGYTVVDATEDYADSPQILKCVEIETDSLYLQFLEIDSNDNATAIFNIGKSQAETFKGNGAVESSVSVGNYQKYTLKTNEKYYVTARVGATAIYAHCDKAESEQLDGIIKELNY